MAGVGSAVHFGPYRVQERLGEGGMCNVFRARREGEETECALKVLKDEWRQDERVRQMFMTEADVSLMIDHPNLVRGLDAGEVNGRLFLALELIEGGSLGEMVEACRSLRFPLPPDLAMYAVSELLEGLHALHESKSRSGTHLGLVHRDVSPHNVFCSFDGRVILGDFGVAQVKAYGETGDQVPLGKLGYMAPEMVHGESLDRRADVFSCGIVLYELLTGHVPLEADSEEEGLARTAEARIPRPSRFVPSLPRALETVLLTATARRARDRFQTAEEFLLELEPFWSKQLANPFAFRALWAAVRPRQAKSWAERHRPRSTTIESAWPSG
jgi:serine/threonine-protein kinase